MNYRFFNPGRTRLNGHPFICLKIPFVCINKPVIHPLVGHNIPLVRNKGFSLIELIITMTIAGILMAVAAPGMVGFVSSNRLASQVNDLIADINLARSEAIKRGVDTGLCPTAVGGTACVAPGNWANGWLVYYVCPSTDVTCVLNSNVALKIHEALTGNNTLAFSGGNTLVYSRNGVISGATGDFTLCDPKRGKSRVLSVAPTGRPTLTESTCP